MFKSLKRNFFPFIIAFSALSISASAAFYSVSGLSKLFAGAQLEVIIMAGSLEFGKLVIASLLYQYWDSINKWLRTYLTIAATVLVLITSMGIYGFLSAAYQETYQKLVVQQNEISFLDNKAKFYEDDVIRYDEELERISNNISTLSNARSQQIQVRDTSVVGGVRTTISTSEIRLAQSRIKAEETNRKAVQAQRVVAADSLQKFKLQILELQNTADTVGELGPLQYLSGLTGAPMDKIINILLLIIIFVFDPLAISMVIAANFAFDKANPKREEDEETPYEPILTDEWEDDADFEPNDELRRAAERYNDSKPYYDDNYDDSGWTDDNIADLRAEPKPPNDITIDKENAESWGRLAEELAKGAVEEEEEENPWLNDPEVQDFLERVDEPGPWSDDESYLVAGLTNDKEGGFMEFQKKQDEWDEEHALDQVLNNMVEEVGDDLWEAEDEIAEAEDEIEELEDEIREIDVIDPKEVSSKFEVEDTTGNVNVYDENENTDRVSTFPNENNPTSVASVVKDLPNDFGTYPPTVQKIETPHLPEESKVIEKQVIKPKPITTNKDVEPGINEDELFDDAMRKKAEQDKLDFLKKRDDKQN